MALKFEKSHPEKDKIIKLRIFDWKIWESPPPPGFEWEFDEKIMAYIIEGDAEVRSGEDIVKVAQGDLFVVYPNAGICQWTVKRTVRIHYKVL